MEDIEKRKQLKIIVIFANIEMPLPMLKIKQLLLIGLIIFSNVVLAQSHLIVQGTTPDLYINHTVSAKETWFSIGRLYNISPNELAPFNQVELEKPLSIGQQVKIPLKEINFSQDGRKASDEVFVPVYHIIQEKEWLYRISVNHNKVPVETLEKWNNITKDDAKAGTALIVGFLKVKPTSALAQTTAVKTPPVVSTPVNTQPEKKLEANKIPPTTAKTDEVKQPPAVQTKKAETPPANEVKTVADTKSANGFSGGYFKSQFEQSGKESYGISGVFKSTSGWNDGKYYALMNGVPVGTIIKVNFPSTNKAIYAKVLGQLPDMRESSGLTIRISDAAAAELGAGNNKFTVDVRY